jgi:hypothetical protein
VSGAVENEMSDVGDSDGVEGAFSGVALSVSEAGSALLPVGLCWAWTLEL